MPTLRETVAVWERIAYSYAPARKRPWPQVVEFIDTPAPGGWRLDLGCGGGRHTVPLAGTAGGVAGVKPAAPLGRASTEAGGTVAVDAARAMLIEARKTVEGAGLKVHLVQASATALPFRFETFDRVIFVASLHNIPGRFQRRRAIDELALAMKPGTEALVTVWTKFDLVRTVRRITSGPPKPTSEVEPGDAYEPWTRGGSIERRYYHFYTRAELDEDVRSTGLVVASVKTERVATRYLADNLFAVVRKSSP